MKESFAPSASIHHRGARLLLFSALFLGAADVPIGCRISSLLFARFEEVAGFFSQFFLILNLILILRLRLRLLRFRATCLLAAAAQLLAMVSTLLFSPVALGAAAPADI